VAALAAGCNDFLTKSVSLEWFNNKIIEWGSKSEALSGYCRC
jgi:osomolarity two-component system response regulator SSK1